jgi:hypothetical protein
VLPHHSRHGRFPIVAGNNGGTKKTLTDMASGKFLGLDSIIVEFYKFLWPVFGAEYLSMLQGAIERGSLLLGVTEGLTS